MWTWQMDTPYLSITCSVNLWPAHATFPPIPPSYVRLKHSGEKKLITLQSSNFRTLLSQKVLSGLEINISNALSLLCLAEWHRILTSSSGTTYLQMLHGFLEPSRCRHDSLPEWLVTHASLPDYWGAGYWGWRRDPMDAVEKLPGRWFFEAKKYHVCSENLHSEIERRKGRKSRKRGKSSRRKRQKNTSVRKERRSSKTNRLRWAKISQLF